MENEKNDLRQRTTAATYRMIPYIP